MTDHDVMLLGCTLIALGGIGHLVAFVWRIKHMTDPVPGQYVEE